MTVLSDDVVGSCRDSAIYKLVIVLVNIRKQVKTEVRLTIDSFGVTSNGIDHVCLEGLVRRAQVLSAQFIEFLLVESSLVPHLVNSFLCPFGKEEREGQP